MQTRDQEAARHGAPITTEVLPCRRVLLAEDYHQKYYLRKSRDLIREFRAMYPNDTDLVASTAAARVTATWAGYGTTAALGQDIERLGLSAEARQACKRNFSAGRDAMSVRR